MSSLLFFCFAKEKLSDIYFAVADALVVRVDVLVVVDIVIVIDDLILRVHWRDQTGVPHVPTRPQPHLPLICLPSSPSPNTRRQHTHTLSSTQTQAFENVSFT